MAIVKYWVIKMRLVDRVRLLVFVVLVSFSVPGHYGAEMSCVSDSSELRKLNQGLLLIYDTAKEIISL